MSRGPVSRRSDTIDYIADKDNISKDEAKMQFAEYTDQAKEAIQLEATMLHKQRIMKEIARRKALGLKPYNRAGGGYTPQKKARKAKLDYRKGGYFT